MKKTSAWLRGRRERNEAPFPSLFAVQYLVVAINLVLLAFLVFDGPLAAGPTYIPPFVRELGTLITDIGRSGWILVASALVFSIGWAMTTATRMQDRKPRFRRLRVVHLAAYVFMSVGAAALTVNILKRVVGRARPTNFEEWGTFGFSPLAGDFLFESFPSGHSTTIGALFMAAALLVPRYRMLFGLAAIWLAMTRVMIGVHHPSDVIAGLAWGSWWSLAVAVAFSRYRIVFYSTRTGPPIPRYPLFKTG